MNGRRFLLILAIVAFIGLGAFIIFSIDFGGSGDTKKTPERSRSITDYADSTVRVRMSVRGSVESDAVHEGLVITVGRTTTRAELTSGYEGAVVRSTSTPNNETSYKTFLSALLNSGFTIRKEPRKGLDFDGACASGELIVFEFIGEEDIPESLWATSCSSKDGTYGGSIAVTRGLFQRQIPREDFQELTKNSSF